ncbi:MAG: response regulator, partial [Candidatus Mcinerneyibacterium aminivorans]
MEKNFKILVVDDEEALREILEEILVDMGYEVVTAEDGYVALNEIKKNNDIDIVLTDIKMPRMDGLELVKNIKAESSAIIPIMMTGYIDSDILVSVLRAGAYDFIPKPFDAQAVKMILERSVKKRRMVLENKKLMKKLKKANSKLKEQRRKLEKKVWIGDKILEKKYKELKYINDTMEKINTTMDYRKTIHFILSVVQKLIGSNRASIMLLTEDKKRLKVVDMIGRSMIKEEIEIGEGVAGWVAEKNKMLYIKDTEKADPEIKKMLKRNRYEAKSFVSLPLNTVKRGLIGVLNVTSNSSEKVITEDEVDILKIFSQQAAAGIETSLTYQELQEHYLHTIKALSNAIEAKDEYTRGHAERVTELSVKLAEEIGYEKEEIRTLKFGGILHDIGK